MARAGPPRCRSRLAADLGRSGAGTPHDDAYVRSLVEYLEICEREGVDPVAANRAHVAVFVRELTSRPRRHGANVVSIGSGAGLSNASPASMTALLALARADAILLWDPADRRLIAANIVGTWLAPTGVTRVTVTSPGP